MSKAAELAALIGSQTALSNRNLIINGAMQVAQRGTTALTGNPEAGFSCDRFEFYQGGDADVTLSQSTDAPSGSGFANSLKFDVVSADTSLGSSELYVVRQKLEGQDLQSMKKGTSSAEAVTMQFWIKSSKTGTYIVELFDIDNTRQISKSYTVSSANTWEHKTITFEGDTSGTFDNDNARSLDVQFWIASGSDYTSGTLSTTWTANTSANRAVGQVNALDNASNEIYITGVQLEVGEQATPFEHRSIGDELLRCQRYYFRINEGVIYQRFAVGSCANTNNAQTTITLPVTMRATPSVHSTGTTGDYAFFEAGTVHTLTSLPSINSAGSSAESVNVTATSTGNYVAGNAGEFLANNDASVFLALSAEL